MAEVFLSYKRAERNEVIRVAERLQELGVSVWLDQRLECGLSFDEEINREVRSAGAVLVCWSPEAIDSKWVRAEAAIGLERERLVAAFVAPTELFPPYNLIHASDLSDWDGAWDHPEWQGLLARIGKLVGRPGLPDLALALHASDAESLAAWAANHPEDPKAAEVFAETEKRWREVFEARIEEVRTRQAALDEERPARFERRLAETRQAFDHWIIQSRTRPADELRKPPDPRHLVEEGLDALQAALQAATLERDAAAALADRELRRREDAEARLAISPADESTRRPLGAPPTRVLELLVAGPVMLLWWRQFALFAVVYVATPLLVGLISGFVFGIKEAGPFFFLERGFVFVGESTPRETGQHDAFVVLRVAAAVLGTLALVPFWRVWLLPPSAKVGPGGPQVTDFGIVLVSKLRFFAVGAFSAYLVLGLFDDYRWWLAKDWHSNVLFGLILGHLLLGFLSPWLWIRSPPRAGAD